MKKWIISFCVMLGLFLAATWMINSLLPDRYEVLEKNWGIEIPKATEIKDLLTTESSFNGDGEWFTVYYYSEPVDFKNIGFEELSSENINIANQRINDFITRTIDIRKDEQVVEVFENYAAEPEIGDYFHYVYRNEGYDTIALLYKSKLNALYKYEWHQ